jgi:hypothetical protein
MAEGQKRTGRKKAITRLHCNQCRRTTYHRLLKTVDNKDSEVHEQHGEQFLVWWHITHELFECGGCKSVMVRRTDMHSEWDEPDVLFFPPRVSRHKPTWIYQIPRELRIMLNEVYDSLAADTRALPLMGARAVLDLLFVDKVGDIGSFAKKLEELERQGFISRTNREILDAALDAGNAASHRAYAPELEQVHSVMEIVENLVHATYVLDKVADEVKKTTPSRSAKSKTVQVTAAPRTARSSVSIGNTEARGTQAPHKSSR